MPGKDLSTFISEYKKLRAQFKVVKRTIDRELVFGLSDFIFKKGNTDGIVVEKITDKFYIKTTRLNFLRRLLENIEKLNTEFDELCRVNKWKTF